MPVPTPGRLVLFALDCGPSAGQLRPALIVRTWDGADTTVQLQVFPDRVNDGPDEVHVDWFRSSCAMGTDPGTWQWPPLPPAPPVWSPVGTSNG